VTRADREKIKVKAMERKHQEYKVKKKRQEEMRKGK
jgi:hypothetical protein